ncbi:site-specific recombinase [Klebsiella michiganensis HKOPL1]|uniref:recombinase family protein n=1 Tax=Klebsiella TaxID=570 RepID=UPI000444C45C|nr:MULTISPECIES: recombinase family protein [Klebsiella]HBM2935273.1 recombinase family protein [Klebsiella michiganensis]HBM7345878.1 recombinase family protein [Klebsiella oxytoca]AHW90285.1 site-specific recombinase [Klebsiella michiganensis HKOPL1]KAA0494025.1 recombinase family protein [Klebsiella grimontii]PEN25081.1 resolvase [Klebsiella sp. MBT K-1]
MNTYAYTRVSKADSENGTTDNQIHLIRSQLDIDMVFSDVNISGSMPFIERPEAKKLLSYLNKGDTVVIAKLDRGFRDTADCLNTVNLLKKKKIFLKVLDISLDLSSPIGEMILTIMASVATFERKRIAERIKDGFSAGRSKGKKYGYNNKNTKAGVIKRNSKRQIETQLRYESILECLRKLPAKKPSERVMLAHLEQAGIPVSRNTLRKALGK